MNRMIKYSRTDLIKGYFLFVLFMLCLFIPLSVSAQSTGETNSYRYREITGSVDETFQIVEQSGSTIVKTYTLFPNYPGAGPDQRVFTANNNGSGDTVSISNPAVAGSGILATDQGTPNARSREIILANPCLFAQRFNVQQTDRECEGVSDDGGGGQSTGGGGSSGGGSTTATPGAQGTNLDQAPTPQNIFNESREEYEATNCKEDNLNEQNCGILKWVSIAINTMTVIFGIIAVTMLAYGGIEYTISRDNPQMTAKAKERIRNVIIAVVAYVFLYAFLQFIIPGGVL